MSLKIGSLVFATDQGLGILAKAFVDHGVVTHPIIVNYTRRGKTVQHNEWYPGAPLIGDLKLAKKIVLELSPKPDVMLFFETPFDWELIPLCRRHGIKTAIMSMHECMPAKIPYQPDIWLCPSLLDAQWASQYGTNKPDSIHYIPVPVEVPWRQRTRAEVFVHNAGWGGLKGRNGTRELIDSLKFIQSPARIIIRSQEPLKWQHVDVGTCASVDLIIGTQPAETLWDEGDVFVFPERFNGLSLPLQEARAAGMLVMCGDRFPMNQWLPREPLIPIFSYRKNRIGPPYTEFEEAIIPPARLAATIDYYYGKDISEYSLSGRTWAESMSWEVLKPKYMEVLERLVAG